MMSRFEHIVNLIAKCNYKDWLFKVHLMGDGHYLQVHFSAPDSEMDGEPTLQRGRKWYISPYACDSEIVSTAWLAVKTAEEHEARENFTFEGKRIFGPHINIEALRDVCDNTEARMPPSMTA